MKSPEERAEEILENVDCFVSLEDEVLKLISLFTCCSSNFVREGEEFISRRYILEKTTRLLRGSPIILDNCGKKHFVKLKVLLDKEGK